MTDKEFDRQSKRVQRLVNKWLNLLPISNEQIYIYYERQLDTDDPTTNAKCCTEWEYRRYTIHYFIPRLAQLSDSEAETDILHELSHVLLASIDASRVDTERLEYATQTVTHSLLSVHQRSQREK